MFSQNHVSQKLPHVLTKLLFHCIDVVSLFFVFFVFIEEFDEVPVGLNLVHDFNILLEVPSVPDIGFGAS